MHRTGDVIREDGALVDLQSALAGTVIARGDPDTTRHAFASNALVDRRPAVIARCLGPADVATAFDFARTHDLEVAVRGGGHNPAGTASSTAGSSSTSRCCGQWTSTSTRRLRKRGGGSTWLDFDSATQAIGLVTPGGVVGSTGVCGLTLGGGIGHLTAQYGLTCDNLLGAELVSPDGSVIRASSDENPELLWGLRGGGGNFGVVTRLEFRLERLDRVVGGLLDFRGSAVADNLRRFRDLVASSPPDLSCQAIVALDESLAPALIVAPCYTGTDADPGELPGLRSWSGLVNDGIVCADVHRSAARVRFAVR